MSIRLTGKPSLAYQGVNASTPYNAVDRRRAPTIKDLEYNLGDFWYETGTDNVYVLISKKKNAVTGVQEATWAQLYPVVAPTLTFNTDTLSVVPNLSMINDFGNTVTTATSASGNTITIGLKNGANGQTLIGGGSQPLWANLTSPGGTVAITNGANSINLEATGTIGISMQTDDAVIVTPAAGALTIAGGTNINTAGAGNTVTVNLDNNVDIAGSLQVQTLGAGVVQTDAVGEFFSDNGTDGQILIGDTGGISHWANITSMDASVVISNGPNTINIEASGGSGSGSTPGMYSFLAYLPSNVGIALGTSRSEYFLGSGPALVELYDIGNNFSVGGGAAAYFQAPVDGKYYFNFNVTVIANSRAVTQGSVVQINSPPSFSQIPGMVRDDWIPSGVIATLATANSFALTAGNRVYFPFRTNGSGTGANYTIQGSTATNLITYISGFMLT